MKPKHALYTVSVDFADNGDIPTIVIMHRDSDKPGACVRHVRTLRGQEAIKFHDRYLLTDQEKLNAIADSLRTLGVESSRVSDIVNELTRNLEKMNKEVSDE